MGVVIHAEDRFLARRKKKEEPVDPIVAKLQAARQALKENKTDNPNLRPNR